MSSDNSFRRRLTDTAPAQAKDQSGYYLDAVDRAVNQLRRAGVVQGALREGEIAPEFVLQAGEGSPVAIAELLNQGPVILTFIRGGWCPYCGLLLEALQARYREIRELGAEIIAISFETHSENVKLAKQADVAFPILHDPDGHVARLFGVLYHVPPELVSAYREQGIDLPGRQGTDQWLLPLAATYVIDQNSVARYAYVEADSSKRPDPDDMLAAMRDIRAD